MYAADRVKPGGQMILQTRNPGSALFSCLRNFNTARFYREELRQREALRYPPYSKMVLLTVESGAEPALAGREYKNVEVLGPVPSITRRGKKVWKILLKAPAKAELKPAVETVLEKLGGRSVSVDVDPVEM
jgi:primosomal protein N' (replication factor Y)